ASMLGVCGGVGSRGLKIPSWSMPTSSRMMNRMLGGAGGLGFGAAAARADHPMKPTTRRALNGGMRRAGRKEVVMVSSPGTRQLLVRSPLPRPYIDRSFREIESFVNSSRRCHEAEE